MCSWFQITAAPILVYPSECGVSAIQPVLSMQFPKRILSRPGGFALGVDRFPRLYCGCAALLRALREAAAPAPCLDLFLRRRTLSGCSQLSSAKPPRSCLAPSGGAYKPQLCGSMPLGRAQFRANPQTIAPPQHHPGLCQQRRHRAVLRQPDRIQIERVCP